MRYQIVGEYRATRSDVNVLVEAESVAAARTQAVAMGVTPLAVAPVEAASAVDPHISQELPLAQRPIHVRPYRGLLFCAGMLMATGVALPALLLATGLVEWIEAAQAPVGLGMVATVGRGFWPFLSMTLSAALLAALLFAAAFALLALRDLARTSHLRAQSA